MSDTFEQTTVGDIVATNYQTAAVFERFGIDFCCGGRRSLAEACRTAAADPAVVAQALRSIPGADVRGEVDVTSWPLDRLVHHIIDTHHAYLKSALPLIGAYLTKLVAVHGERHPELARVSALFDQLGTDLRQHMLKEEHVLFPYLCELASPHAAHPSPFGTVENPIRMMEREHQDAGDDLRQIRELTNGFTVPADGCATYCVCFAELARFESDLHRHVHLENNVLFPRAVAAEHHVWRG
jgi:regulator of cell morphogenesis and NO signaling